MKSILFWSSLLITFTASCRSSSKSEVKWLTGAHATRGHEDITRLAVATANATLATELGQSYYPDIPRGLNAAFSDIPLIKGNYETDNPGSKMRAWVGVSSGVDWHNSPDLQHLHSLRNRVNGQFVSNRTACLQSRKAVAKAAIHAINITRAGDRNEGLYWIGHATHIIQDSYSPAHTARNGNRGEQLVEYCTYGSENSNICYHHTADLRDAIWKDSPACNIDPNNRSRSCMKEEASWAADATADFLVTVGRLILTGASSSEAEVEKALFDQGVMRCETTGDNAVADPVAIEAINPPGFFIRHKGFNGFLDPVHSAQDRQDSTFYLRKGLANSDCVSFEAVNFAGHYLRHKNFAVSVDQDSSDSQFKADATFCVTTMDGAAGGVSLSAVSPHQAFSLRHQNFNLSLSNETGPQAQADKGFFIQSRP